MEKTREMLDSLVKVRDYLKQNRLKHDIPEQDIKNLDWLVFWIDDMIG